MDQTVDAIFQAALALPPDTRISLAEKLYESLDPNERGEIEAAWKKEVEERFRAYDEGKVKVIPGDEVLRSLPGRKKP